MRKHAAFDKSSEEAYGLVRCEQIVRGRCATLQLNYSNLPVVKSSKQDLNVCQEFGVDVSVRLIYY